MFYSAKSKKKKKEKKEAQRLIDSNFILKLVCIRGTQLEF